VRRLFLAARLAVVGIGGVLPGSAIQGQAQDSLTTWLDWGSLAFLIKADTSHGVQLWANALVARKDGAEPRTFVARYDPAAVVTWAMDAELLLLPDRVGPNDPPKLLAVTPLTDLKDGQFVTARRREGPRWARKVVFSFNAKGEEPLTFSVERSQATELFGALVRAARRSHLRDGSLTSRLNSCGITDPVSDPPVRLTTGTLLYPDHLRDQHIPGLTVVSFIVDTTGRPLMDEGFRVIFSTNPAFTRATLVMVSASTFRAAMHNGKPTRVAVCQPVLFMIKTR
jgi:hypothetical protein